MDKIKRKRKPTGIGTLRHRIVIENLTLASDGQGGSTETWATFKEVWAIITPVSSRERLYAERIEYQRSHKMIIRYLPGLTNTMRVQFHNRTFQVKGFTRFEEKKSYMQVDLEENQGT